MKGKVMCEKCATTAECDECGAGPGEECPPWCLAPVGPGGPHENDGLDNEDGDEP